LFSYYGTAELRVVNEWKVFILGLAPIVPVSMAMGAVYQTRSKMPKGQKQAKGDGTVWEQ